MMMTTTFTPILFELTKKIENFCCFEIFFISGYHKHNTHLLRTSCIVIPSQMRKWDTKYMVWNRHSISDDCKRFAMVVKLFRPCSRILSIKRQRNRQISIGIKLLDFYNTWKPFRSHYGGAVEWKRGNEVISLAHHFINSLLRELFENISREKCQ